MQKTSQRLNTAGRRRLFVLAAAALVLLLLVAGCTGTVQAPADTPAAQEQTVPAQPTQAAPAEATQPPEAEAPAAEPTPTPDAAAIQAAIADFLVDTPPTEEVDGVPVGFTAGGLPYRGDPDAPVIMVEYSDFQCPFCARYAIETQPAIDEKYVAGGQVRVVFSDFPLVQLHPGSPQAHAAGLCVAEQGAAAYWAMHQALFASVDEWGGADDAPAIFARLAEESGADMDAYNACVDAGDTAALVEERIVAAQRKGFGGTPSFQFIRVADGGLFQLVGAQPFSEFSALIDGILAGESPQAVAAAAEAEAAAQAEIPFWATPDGWASDPERPGFNMAGDQYKGSLNAPITMIEFSDFQCPYCKEFAENTQPTLFEQYVDTGKVLWVFKHFPLEQIHPAAPNAAIAAECAAEQGKFWEMHEALFADQAAWSGDDPDAALLSLADDLGLDVEAFGACQIDPDIAERVANDLQEGTPFIQATPSFILLFQGQGGVVQGARPVEDFTNLFDEIAAQLPAE